ncbi:MAG TPA: hypothetical protein VE641_15315, partial [Chthoniobacterales bacterium]|nr:hypothetical protein [Chthoniobacterales bacterium]
MRASSQSPTQIYRQAPCAALRRIIQHFLVIEFPSVHRDAHLPETDAVAAFSFRGACRIDETRLAPPAAFTGPRDVLRTHEHLDGHAVLLATFTPVGAYTFLRAPLEEFTGYTVSLTDLIGSPGEELSLSDRLNSAKNHRQR